MRKGAKKHYVLIFRNFGNKMELFLEHRNTSRFESHKQNMVIPYFGFKCPRGRGLSFHRVEEHTTARARTLPQVRTGVCADTSGLWANLLQLYLTTTYLNGQTFLTMSVELLSNIGICFVIFFDIYIILSCTGYFVLIS